MSAQTQPPSKSRISIDLTDEHDIYYNISQTYILITEDKVQLCLRDHLARVAKQRRWIAPLGIMITLVATFATTTFKDFARIGADTVQIIFVLAMLFTALWLCYEAKRALRSSTVEDIIADMKRRSRPQTEAVRLQGTGAPTPLPIAPLSYDFIHHFPEAEQTVAPGSHIEPHLTATCGQESKRAIFEHPPSHHNEFSALTYHLTLEPEGPPLELVGFLGIETEISEPDGLRPSQRRPDNAVLFEILINDEVRLKRHKQTSEWDRFSIPITRAGKLSICFRTNCLGDNTFNWAVWGEPQLEVVREFAILE